MSGVSYWLLEHVRVIPATPHTFFVIALTAFACLFPCLLPAMLPGVLFPSLCTCLCLCLSFSFSVSLPLCVYFPTRRNGVNKKPKRRKSLGRRVSFAADDQLRTVKSVCNASHMLVWRWALRLCAR